MIATAEATAFQEQVLANLMSKLPELQSQYQADIYIGPVAGSGNPFQFAFNSLPSQQFVAGFDL
jgi:hypothetical protein